jgi:hypothetical protein
MHAETLRTIASSLKGSGCSCRQALRRSPGERLAHLHPGAAQWQLYEFDERHDALTAIDYADRGNIATRLVHCPDEVSTLERFSDSIHHVLSLLPECEVAVLSTAEVAFRWRGLEFARTRVAHEARSFRNGQEIVFGISNEERVLEGRSAPDIAELVQSAGSD